MPRVEMRSSPPTSSKATRSARASTSSSIPKDRLELAGHIVETKAGHFNPSKFDDRYEDALKDLLKKKQEGKPIERPERREPTNVVNLMEALRRSVEASGKSATGKGKARSSARRSTSERAEHP